ncbi:MAG: ferredoxin domain-containing protein [Anaerolineales bacterium]
MQSIEVVAQMMEIAAITAPKTKGENYVQVKILLGEDVRTLGEKMIAFGEEHHRTNFDRDGRNVMNSQAVVLIGIKDAKPAGLNCSACGYATCTELEEAIPVEEEFKGPICAYRLLDMGIALGSAVKTASLFNVDNRIMYRIGTVARANGLVDWDFVMGVPLSVSGKSIYFDR